MLLVHDVAANDASIIVDDQRTIATFADRGDVSLWYTMGIVCISEFKQQLLLHVVGYDTLVGDSCPEVLVAIDIYYVGRSFDTHATIDLLHVALEVLRLWVVDAESCCCLNPQSAFQCLLDADDIAVGQ